MGAEIVWFSGGRWQQGTGAKAPFKGVEINKSGI